MEDDESPLRLLGAHLITASGLGQRASVAAAAGFRGAHAPAVCRGRWGVWGAKARDRSAAGSEALAAHRT